MSDPILPPPSPPQAPPSPPEEMSAQEINDGKVLAALGYPISIIAVVMFFVRNNRFSFFHAKQMVTLIIVQLALIIPFFALSCLVPMFLGVAGSAGGGGSNAGAAAAGLFGVVMCLVYVVIGAVCIASLVLVIIGLINAIQGQAKPLPLIGALAQKWFGHIRPHG